MFRWIRVTSVLLKWNLLGDHKAHEKLGWKPETTLQEMVSEMVAKDLEAAKKHSLLKSHGYEVAIALES
ncbi:MAG: hypothetical protein ACLTXH_07955 [Enterobacter hormaechei]